MNSWEECFKLYPNFLFIYDKTENEIIFTNKKVETILLDNENFNLLEKIIVEKYYDVTDNEIKENKVE